MSNSSQQKTAEAGAAPLSVERENYMFLTKLAEQAERYEDMIANMKVITKMGHELSVDERNFLSLGYKNVIGGLRGSWRIVSAFEQKEEARGNAKHVEAIRAYRAKVEGELTAVCGDILGLVDGHILPKVASNEGRVYFLKMKGDYYRYLSEFRTGDVRKATADKAHEAYQAATEAAQASLPPTNPVRLGLALNYSVFFYEILMSPERACTLSKQAFDEALAEIDTLSDESYSDSQLIMQLLRDNLMLWMSDLQEGKGDEGEPEPANSVGSNGNGNGNGSSGNPPPPPQQQASRP